MEPFQRLKLARERAGYDNVVDAAKAYGWKAPTYISHENGTRGLRTDVAKRYAKAFKVTADWLIFGDAPASRQSAQKRGGGDTVMVPLISWVSAGRLTDAAVDDTGDHVPVAGLGRGEFLALRVIGDSMDRVSPDGSIIIVDRTAREPVNGRYYVFSIRGEATFKVFRSGDPAYLAPHSTNPENRPIFIKGKRDLQVVGRVRRTILDL